jgi:hypothetical protein
MNNIINDETNNTYEINDNKIKKTENMRTYMREYMREYNLKKYGEKKKMTAEQKKENLRRSHKKYYLKNKPKLLENQKEKVKKNRIVRLRKQLRELEENI